MNIVKGLEKPGNVNAAWSVALVSASIFTGMLVNRPVEPELNPGTEAEVIARSNPRPGMFSIALRQCGYETGPNIDEQGCYSETMSVQRAQFLAYSVGEPVTPAELIPRP